MPTDKELVKKAARGDRMAFERIYHNHRNDLLTIAMSLTCNKNLAEDVVQDVFVSFARSVGRLQVRGCEILDGHAARDHVVLEAGVIHAVISENTSRAPFTVINKAKGKTVIRDNLGEA